RFGAGEGEVAIGEFAALLGGAMSGCDVVARVGPASFCALFAGEAERRSESALGALAEAVARRNRHRESAYPLAYRATRSALEAARPRSGVERLRDLALGLGEPAAHAPAQSGGGGGSASTWLAALGRTLQESRLAGTACMALAYWVTGWLGLLLAIPP